MISKPCFARHFAQVMVNYHNGVLGGQPPDIDELKSECMYVSTSTMRKKVHLLRLSSIWAYSLWTTCAVNFWLEGSGNIGPILRSLTICSLISLDWELTILEVVISLQAAKLSVQHHNKQIEHLFCHVTWKSSFLNMSHVH